MTDAQDDRPVLRVVAGGEPTAEELAAVVVALASLHTGAADAPAPRSVWADRGAVVRKPVRPGPDGWRRSRWLG